MSDKKLQYKYTFMVPSGSYVSNSIVDLVWKVFKHRMWHLFKHGKWMD